MGRQIEVDETAIVFDRRLPKDGNPGNRSPSE